MLDPGLGFGAVAAVVYGVYLVAVKRFFDGYPAPVYLVVVNAVAFALYAPVALAVAPPGGMLPPGGEVRAVAAIVAAAVATAAAVLAFFAALGMGEVSYVTPLNKVVPAFVLPIEVALLGARLAAWQVAGVLVVTAAIYAANYETGSLLAPFRRALTTRAAQLALLSAAAFAVVDVAKRVMLQELAIPPGTYVWLTLGTVGLVLAPLAVRHWPRARREVRGDLRRFVAAAVLLAGAQHATALCFERTVASIASPLVNTQAVVAVLLGGLLLDEGEFGYRLAAAGLAVAGIALVTLGDRLPDAADLLASLPALP